MPTNRQVWQDEAGVPSAIREIPAPLKVEDSEVLVKVKSWAINPCDAILQDQSLPFIKYPIILGQDVAGIVEMVGSAAASKFKVGDRVFGFSHNNGFQEYVVLNQLFTAKIPDPFSFNDVSVFPLCITTSAVALFGQRFLGLPLPSLTPTSTGKSVLIWGGGSSVGSNAIQLTNAAGFEVITTCSATNFDYVKSLGASKTFDYHSPSAIDDLVAELDKNTCAGIYLAAGNPADACQVSHKSKQNLPVASSNPLSPGDVPNGVDAKWVFGDDIAGMFKDIYPITFGGFLPEALAKGVYKIAPPPQVVSTKGVEGIQVALDVLKKGVSAKKVVVEAE